MRIYNILNKRLIIIIYDKQSHMNVTTICDKVYDKQEQYLDKRLINMVLMELVAEMQMK